MPCENELACEYTRQTITHSRLCRDSPPMMLTFNSYSDILIYSASIQCVHTLVARLPPPSSCSDTLKHKCSSSSNIINVLGGFDTKKASCSVKNYLHCLTSFHLGLHNRKFDKIDNITHVASLYDSPDNCQLTVTVPSAKWNFQARN